jgi:hypothetical protein
MTPDPWVRTSYADACTVCLEHVVHPDVVFREGGQADCLYQCPCGHTWRCGWSVGAVEGWGVLDGHAAA